MELYPFQQEDVEKLQRHKAGAIASEMGAGKTHEAIALDEIWNPDGRKPTLVIAPLNTFDSWREKYGIQSPRTDVITIDRKNRSAFSRAIASKRGDVFLMHWDALRFMPELAKVDLSVIIADEAHRASNRKAQATRALKKLHADHKLALSGSMSGDKPENLWSIFNWLYPKYYSTYWGFRKHYCVEEKVERFPGDASGYTKIVGVKNEDALHEEISPWWTRHLKREQCCPHHPIGVMPWLKEKTYDTIWVDLNPTQRRLYEQMRKEMVAWVGEHEDSPLVASVVVAQMVRLTQMALATPHFDTEMRRVRDPLTGEYARNEDGGLKLVPEQVVKLTEPSSKIDAVKELIGDHSNKQFVVFSSSKQACYLAAESFARSGITSEVLSGDTPQGQRDGMVGRFNRGGFQVFIGVIAAAAEGIDGLQRSTDTAIFLDRSWSTIKNQQAEDRLHRDGQGNSVQIIDVMARNTLDWGRQQRLIEKWSWIKKILGDPVSAQAAAMSGKLEEM